MAKDITQERITKILSKVKISQRISVLGPDYSCGSHSVLKIEKSPFIITLEGIGGNVVLKRKKGNWFAESTSGAEYPITRVSINKTQKNS